MHLLLLKKKNLLNQLIWNVKFSMKNLKIQVSFYATNFSITSFNYCFSETIFNVVGEKFPICPTCHDVIDDTHDALFCPQCKTDFHDDCLERWEPQCLKNGNEYHCPVCRYVFESESDESLHFLQELQDEKVRILINLTRSLPSEPMAVGQKKYNIWFFFTQPSLGCLSCSSINTSGNIVCSSINGVSQSNLASLDTTSSISSQISAYNGLIAGNTQSINTLNANVSTLQTNSAMKNATNNAFQGIISATSFATGGNVFASNIQANNLKIF